MSELEGQKIEEALTGLCEGFGLEVAPFQIGWYNEALNNKDFAITSVPDDTLAFVIISNPSMFDKTFVPFVQKMAGNLNLDDPLDQCMRETFDSIISDLCARTPELREGEVDAVHSFDKNQDGRHALSCQSAAAVSGITQLYKKEDLDDEGMKIYKNLLSAESIKPKAQERIFSVCLHPLYGGWFSIRGILIFTKVQVAETIQMPVRESLNFSQAETAELLHLWNNHGMDWRYRNFGLQPGYQPYSKLQQEYFLLDRDPNNKKRVLEKIQALPHS